MLFLQSIEIWQMICPVLYWWMEQLLKLRLLRDLSLHLLILRLYSHLHHLRTFPHWVSNFTEKAQQAYLYPRGTFLQKHLLFIKPIREYLCIFYHFSTFLAMIDHLSRHQNQFFIIQKFLSLITKLVY